MGDVELPYPVKFPYPVNIHEYLRNLVIGRPDPVKFYYPDKASVHNSEYFFESKNKQL